METCCKHFDLKNFKRQLGKTDCQDSTQDMFTTISCDTIPGLPMRQHKHGAPAETRTKKTVSSPYTVSQKKKEGNAVCGIPARD